MSIFKDSLKTIILSATVLFLVGIAYAWTEPTSNPPSGNTKPPITTGSSAQTKPGWLTLDYLETYGNTYLATTAGNVGIGTTGPGAKLEVAGQVKITGGTPANGEVLTSDGAGLATWETPSGSGFPSGTSIVFSQASCPSGWTQNVSYNDRMIRIAGTGGGTGGSWIISGLSSAAGGVDHTHGTPSHVHSVPRDGWGVTAYNPAPAGRLQTTSGVYSTSVSANNNTTGASAGTTGGASAVTHSHGISQDGSWRPSYIDAIICVKN